MHAVRRHHELGLEVFVLMLAIVAAIASGPHYGLRLHHIAWSFAGSAVIWIGAAALLRPFDHDTVQRSAMEVLAGVAVPSCLLAAFMVVGKLIYPALPGPLLIVAIVAPAASILRLVRRRIAQAEQRPPALVVGSGPLARATARMLARDFDVQARHKPASLLNVLRAGDVGEVYIAGEAPRELQAMQAAVHVCEQLGVPFALPAWTLRIEHAQPARRHGVDDGFVHFTHAACEGTARADLKHVADLLLSAAALLVLAVPLLAVALAIRLDSRGPIFFKQERVGMRGRRFGMLKFRSMVVDAEKLRARLQAHNEQQGPVFKMVRDPRVTRVGRFIRKYSIDELPQIINVLRGEMSIVGPRPPLASEVAEYAPWQLRRLSVRPGLTCIWQVSGRNHITFHDWMLLDLRYIDTWTLHQDLRLILMTVPSVLVGRGAS